MNGGYIMANKSTVFVHSSYWINVICTIFGAGNLIFPAMLGQSAGENVWIANAGFLVTGVGLPLLGVLAFGFRVKMIYSH